MYMVVCVCVYMTVCGHPINNRTHRLQASLMYANSHSVIVRYDHHRSLYGGEYVLIMDGRHCFPGERNHNVTKVK